MRIVEEKDATSEEKQICEVNSGMYYFNAEALVGALGVMTNDNAQGEYYLTQAIELIKMT